MIGLDAQQGRWRALWLRVSSDAAIFLVFFLVLLKGVDVSLMYHAAGEIQKFPVFFLGWEFIRKCGALPSGVAEYLSSLAMQTLFDPRLGALVLTAQAWAVSACIRSFGRRLGLRWPDVGAFASALLLMALYARYAHHARAVLSLLLVLGALNLVLCFRRSATPLRLGVVLALTAVLYPAAADALPVFAVGAIVIEWRLGTAWFARLAPLLFALAVALLESSFLFGLGVEEIGQTLIPWAWKRATLTQPGFWATVGLYLLVPGLGLLGVLREAILRSWPQKPLRLPDSARQRRKASPTHTRPGGAPAGPGKRVRPAAGAKLGAQPGRWWLREAALLLLLLGVFFVAHDRQFKAVLATDFYATEHRWPEVLEAARTDLGNPFVACSAAQAASHLGILSQTIPPLPTPEDLVVHNRKELACWKKSELYLDLGFVNLAMHFGTEAVEFWGERPPLLWRLVLANLATGNEETARVYLNALARVPFQRKKARHWLQALDADPSMVREPEIVRLRSLMVTNDLVGHFTVDGQMLLLLEANPRNRMAFEYLMTYYLLSRNLPAFVANVSRAEHLPGFKLSPLWKDALALCAWEQSRRQGKPPPNFNDDSQRRLDAFLRAVAVFGGDKELARVQLQKDYGNGYFYYYALGR